MTLCLTLNESRSIFHGSQVIKSGPHGFPDFIPFSSTSGLLFSRCMEFLAIARIFSTHLPVLWWCSVPALQPLAPPKRTWPISSPTKAFLQAVTSESFLLHHIFWDVTISNPIQDLPFFLYSIQSNFSPYNRKYILCWLLSTPPMQEVPVSFITVAGIIPDTDPE